MTGERSDNERFVRWQGITIAQLGYAVNLILGFATASLGFSFLLIRDETFSPPCLAKVLRTLSMFLLMISIALGVFCVNNRLRDFRQTEAIVRRDGDSDET